MSYRPPAVCAGTRRAAEFPSFSAKNPPDVRRKNFRGGGLRLLPPAAIFLISFIRRFPPAADNGGAAADLDFCRHPPFSPAESASRHKKLNGGFPRISCGFWRKSAKIRRRVFARFARVCQFVKKKSRASRAFVNFLGKKKIASIACVCHWFRSKKFSRASRVFVNVLVQKIFRASCAFFYRF